jgi:hypothetical protein
VVQGALHQLEVSGFAQERGPEVVPEVMEAEADHPCPFPQLTPRALLSGLNFPNGQGSQLMRVWGLDT